MQQVSPYIEHNLPWVDSQEDRFFRRMAVTVFLIFMAAGLILNLVTLPEVAQQQLIDVSPRLAKLILEKKKIELPPPTKKAPKAEEKKEKKPEKKKKAEKKKTKKKKKEAVKKEIPTAREVAQQSGLIALSDELSDLRESFDVDSVLTLPQQTTGNKEIEVAVASDLLTSQAKKTSGGISTGSLSKKVQTSELATRSTTAVESKIQSKQETKKKLASRSGKATNRSAEEIERVFQKNKGAIFAIYNRALRTKPSLEGKIVVELTIASNGSVVNVKILSSELDNKKLERKLVLKIKQFKFAKANVPQITVTYPIDFLPS